MSSVVLLILGGVWAALTGSPGATFDHTFETFKSGDEFRWRLMDSKGVVVAISDTNFKTRAKVADEVKQLQTRARTRYQRVETGLTYTQIFTDAKGAYRWQWLKENPTDRKQDQVLAVSGMSYNSLEAATDATTEFLNAIKGAKVSEPKK